MKNDNLLKRFMENVNSDWQWTGNKTKRGYGRLGINYIMVRANRISYELFVGPIPEGMYVLHSCDDPGCVNPDHLHLGTAKDNWHEMLERNRGKFVNGQDHGMSKLTEQQVIQIKKLYRDGIRPCDLAKQFSVTPSMIGNIIHNRNWKHLSDI